MRYLKHVDLLLLGLVTSGCGIVYVIADEQFDMFTKYNPLWTYGVSFFGPLLACVYFVWRYRLYDDRKNLFTAVVTLALIGILVLAGALPRLVLLATAPPPGPVPVLQELDVLSVGQRYARTTYTGSRVRVQYGDTVLVFESSRINYFLLAGARCIRAEIGQAAPGFYYMRNLQRPAGAREQARADYWAFFWRKEGIFLLGFLGIIVAGWLLSLVFGDKLKRIHIR